MSQEEKELLLKDISARLPYGVKCQVQEDEYTYIGTLCRLEVDNKNGNLLDFVESISGLDCQVYLSEAKPYLFPLESMTEEQCYDFYCRFVENEIDYDDFKKYYFDEGSWHKLLTSINDCSRVIDWFHKNHFDYRGLIEKGLANDATGLNLY